MNKKLFILAVFVASIPNISVAQTAGDKAQATIASEPQIQKYGKATLIMKDDKGRIVLNKTERYPIISSKRIEFTNCWDTCLKMCDGYGVCWVSCGLTCSPWTKYRN